MAFYRNGYIARKPAGAQPKPGRASTKENKIRWKLKNEFI